MKKRHLNNISLPYWLFVLAIAIILVVPEGIQDGMFMDGLIYAAVAHNLSLGIGSPLFLAFSETSGVYCEQLPLFFWLEATFFKILGSSIYSERIFGFVMAGITALNIHLIWKEIRGVNKSYSWLPILLWIIIPVCFWCYGNNMQEMLMSVFATLSVLFCFKYLSSENSYGYLIWAGLSIFLCSFCKGFQGLFPLVFFGIHWIIFRRYSFKKAIVLTFALLTTPVLIYSLMLLNDTTYLSLSNNFNNRIVRSFTNPNSITTSTRMYIMFRLFTELIPSFLVAALFIGWNRWIFKNPFPKWKLKYILLFTALGLSGSLPLMITYEQRGFYLVTSLPFFAIAIAILCVESVHQIVERINQSKFRFSTFKGISVLLFVVAISLSFLKIGQIKRDQALLQDVHTLGKHFPKGTIIGIIDNVDYNYSFKAYMIRHYGITCHFSKVVAHEYLIANKGYKGKEIEGYNPQEMKLLELTLYRK